MTFEEVEADDMAPSGTVDAVVVGEMSVSSFDELRTQRAVRHWSRNTTRRCEKEGERGQARRDAPWSNDLPVAQRTIVFGPRRRRWISADG